MECEIEWNMEWNGMELAINKINLNTFIQHSQVDSLLVSGIHIRDLVKQLQSLCTYKLSHAHNYYIMNLLMISDKHYVNIV